jgi:hypothetical protein
MTRFLTAARHVICLILVLVVAVILGSGPAIAQPSDITPPDPSNGADPLDPSSDYSVKLNAEIAAFDARVAAWQAQGRALSTQAQSLRARIAAHNAVVDSFPNRVAPPAVAGPLNAEAAALNSERAALLAQIDVWKSQVGVLEAERLRLLQQIAFILQNQYKVQPPLGTRRPQGGDLGRPLGRNSLGQYTRGNGGDAVSIRKENAALDAYAKAHNVRVDKRQVQAALTTDGLAKLSEGEIAKLRAYRKYDGLVLKPNGHYKALEVKSDGASYQPGQKQFDDAIRRGGQARVVVDGKVVIIDEVEIVLG